MADSLPCGRRSSLTPPEPEAELAALEWRFATVDAPERADPADPDDGWALLPEDPGRIPGNVVWYRAEAEVSPERELGVGLFVLGAYDVYADGVRIGGLGEPGRRMGSLTPTWFELPADVSADGQVTVAVRVWADRTVAQSGGVVYGAALGPIGAVAAEVGQVRTEVALQMVPWLLTGALFLFVGIPWFGMSYRRVAIPGGLAFAVGATLEGLAEIGLALHELGVTPIYPYASPVVRLVMMAGRIGMFTCVGQAMGGSTPVIVGLAALLELSVVLQCFEAGNVVSPITNTLVMVPVMGVLVYWLVRGARDRVPGARTMGAGTLIFGLGPLSGFLTALGVLPAGVWTPYLMPLTTTGLLAAMTWAMSVERVDAAIDELQGERAKALANARLGRFFPKALVARILASEGEALVHSERRLVTLLFANLRGFTELTDRTSPERITDVLNQWLARVVPIVEEHGGTVDKMMGDSLMVLFGGHEPMAAADQASGAVATAIGLHRALEALGTTWRSEGLEHQIRLRVGIHQDHVTVGNFGSDRLVARTAIGGGVNLAMGLEVACPPGRILATFVVVSQVKAHPWAELVEREFEGFARAHKVAELDPTLCDGPPGDRATHLPPNRLGAPELSVGETEHLGTCLRCRAERRVRLGGSPPASAPTIGPYEVLGLLGSGGMGRVYAVRHPVLDQQFAVKVLAIRRPSLRSRLLREAKTQARVDHPHVLPLLDVLDLDGSPALVLPWVPGPNLHVLVEAGRLDPDEVATLFHGIVEGVAAVHRAGLIHRDLKPANILLDPSSGRVVPRIADFGLAKVLVADAADSFATLPGMVLGTPGYAAPEQLAGSPDLDARADVWALGCVAYFLLTGRPYTGDLGRAPIPEPWPGLLARMLAVAPSDRPVDAVELLACIPPVTSDLAGLLVICRELAPKPTGGALTFEGSTSDALS